MNFNKFKKERREVLCSLDKEKIIAYCKKYDVPIPEDEEVFWAGIHKAIVNCKNMPIDKVVDSMLWLTAHGFKYEIV